jgi:hypothetical protein
MKLIFIFLFLYSCCVGMMFVFPVPNWLRDTFSENIGSHRKIKKRASDCADGDLYLRFKNKHERCINYWIYDEKGDIYMNQDISNGCLNSEYHVCVPKDGKVLAKGTNWCNYRESSGITYDTLSTHHKEKNGSGWLDLMIGNGDKYIIPIRARCDDEFPLFYLNGDKDRYYGDPAIKTTLRQDLGK